MCVYSRGVGDSELRQVERRMALGLAASGFRASSYLPFEDRKHESDDSKYSRKEKGFQIALYAAEYKAPSPFSFIGFSF